MDPNELLEALEPVLDAYQRSSPTRRSSTFIEDTVDELYQAVEEFRAKWQQEEDGQQTEDDVLNCLSDVLVHFFDCTISEENTAGCKDSIDAIFQLLTTVAAKRFVLVRELLDRAIECSGVLLERVRACACQFIGLQVSVLLSTEMLNVAERDELLDQASQALIPRITDKAQSVRLAYIQAASCFFSSSNEGDESQTEDDDPELRQGLQWSLQHDPSVTNRVAALEALPATVQMSDLIISRLRDVKPREEEEDNDVTAATSNPLDDDNDDDHDDYDDDDDDDDIVVSPIIVGAVVAFSPSSSITTTTTTSTSSNHDRGGGDGGGCCASVWWYYPDEVYNDNPDDDATTLSLSSSLSWSSSSSSTVTNG